MRFNPERPAADSAGLTAEWRELMADARHVERESEMERNGEKGNSWDSWCSGTDEGNTKNSYAISVTASPAIANCCVNKSEGERYGSENSENPSVRVVNVAAVKFRGDSRNSNWRTKRRKILNAGIQIARDDSLSLRRSAITERVTL
ncbi:hypothetical protein QLX08_010041 [Tetragonisca angustula]|uniref:Uncharacterized protein n=1 Tax=Tetragonisca angustula TaxID=166442 RepID=A0AAW0ZEI5_9HYME